MGLGTYQHAAQGKEQRWIDKENKGNQVRVADEICVLVKVAGAEIRAEHLALEVSAFV